MLSHARALRTESHRRARRGLLALVTGVLAFTLLAAPNAPVSAGSVPEQAAAAPVGTKFGFAMQMGPEERVLGPTRDVDVLYFSERDARNRLIGFAGTSRTYVWRSLGNRRISQPRLIIDRGRPGTFDECGAWLNGSIVKLNRRHWLGWYHAESKGPGQAKCDRVHDTVVFRVGFVETKDGGRTWRKTRSQGLGHNVVLTGTNTKADPSAFNPGSVNGGSPRVLKVNGWYYMLFMAGEPGSQGTHVARAPISSQGRPGAWKKWYCPTIGSCAWDQDAIGGRSTPINGLAAKARYVTWNNYLGRWVGFSGTGRDGFRMFASAPVSGAVTEATRETSLLNLTEDTSSWSASDPFYAPVSSSDDPLVDQWGTHVRNRRSKLLYAYPSMLGATGSSSVTGQSFYVYYVKLYPGDNFDERYLFRRKVTVVKTATGANRVALTTYKTRTGKRRTSTDMPKSKAFRREASPGFLLGAEEDGSRQVMECTRRLDAALFAGGCKRGWKLYRRAGWIYSQRSLEAPVPIFRCFNRRTRSHFASSTPRCNGVGVREIRLGFGLRGLPRN